MQPRAQKGSYLFKSLLLLRLTKKEIEEKSIFLTYCLYFDDKLQKIQNNYVLDYFLDEF